MTTLIVSEYDRDDDLLQAVRLDRKPRARLECGLRPLVVLGRGSRVEEEIYPEPILQDGIEVQRRKGGGCAVVLDPGNVILTLVEPLPGFGGGRELFVKINNWLIKALSRMEISGVNQQGISDLTRGDRKIGGSCIYRPVHLLFYSTTLLVAPDVSLMARYLKHPPREPDYRQKRAHQDFVGSLTDVWRYTPMSFAYHLARSLGSISPTSGQDLEIRVRRQESLKP